MLGFLMPRAMKLRQMCKQLEMPCEQEGDGTVHCKFDTSAGLGLATLMAERDGMLYVMGGTAARCPVHSIPAGLGDFLSARNHSLAGFEWRAKDRDGYVHLLLVGAFSFGSVNVMALASLLNQVAGEVGKVTDILVGRGLFHA